MCEATPNAKIAYPYFRNNERGMAVGVLSALFASHSRSASSASSSSASSSAASASSSSAAAAAAAASGGAGCPPVPSHEHLVAQIAQLQIENRQLALEKAELEADQSRPSPTKSFGSPDEGSALCAGFKGDPHLAFAHGGRADFRGEHGAIYCFLTTPGLALNVKTEESTFLLHNRALTVHGSFITEARVLL